MIKAMEITLARSLLPNTTYGFPWQYQQGWGRLDLTNAFKTDGRYMWNSGTVTSTATDVRLNYTIKDLSRPVTVTLVWTDFPGTTSASQALVNDLDLKVTSNRHYFYGNNFDPVSGRSIVFLPLGQNPTLDRKNNVEQVRFLAADEGGSNQVQIDITVPFLRHDAINLRSPGIPQQDYALFIDNVVGQ
jgi:hypothetical protein